MSHNKPQWATMGHGKLEQGTMSKTYIYIYIYIYNSYYSYIFIFCFLAFAETSSLEGDFNEKEYFTNNPPFYSIIYLDLRHQTRNIINYIFNTALI